MQVVRYMPVGFFIVFRVVSAKMPSQSTSRLSTNCLELPHMPSTSCIMVWPARMMRLQNTGIRPMSATAPTDLKRYSGAFISSARIPRLMPTATLMAMTSTMAIAWPHTMTWFTIGIVIQLLAKSKSPDCIAEITASDTIATSQVWHMKQTFDIIHWSIGGPAT